MYYLFDLDGTLTKPETGITNSIKYALQKFDITEEDMDKLRLCIGPPLIDSFETFWHFPRPKAEQALAYYREYFAVKGLFENEVYEGIPTLLQRLSAKGGKLILATSKPEEYAAQILDHFGLLSYFTAVVGNTLKEDRPKKEDVLAHILTLFPDISKENAIMIGDRKYDIIGAARMGLPSVGVLYGYGDRAEMKAAGATDICETVADLQDFLLERTKL